MLRSRVALALIGMLIFGGGSTIAAVMLSAPHSVSANTASAQTTATPPVGTGSGSSGASADSTPTTDSGVGGGSSASAATPLPTRAPSGPSGELRDLQGTIANVDSTTNTFTLTVSGTARTIHVTPSTVYTGSAHSFTDLQVGMAAQAKVSALSDGSFVAVSIEAQAGVDH